MKWLTLVALVFAVGCAPDVPRVQCKLPVFHDVRAEYDVNCDQLAANILLARKIIVERGIVADEDIEMVFADVPVMIRATDALEGTGEDAGYGDEILMGTYGPADGIVLTQATTALVHEMLHHVDSLVTTHWHVGWEERGYFAAQDQYQHLYRSPVPKTR